MHKYLPNARKCMQGGDSQALVQEVMGAASSTAQGDDVAGVLEMLRLASEGGTVNPEEAATIMRAMLGDSPEVEPPSLPTWTPVREGRVAPPAPPPKQHAQGGAGSPSGAAAAAVAAANGKNTPKASAAASGEGAGGGSGELKAAGGGGGIGAGAGAGAGAGTGAGAGAGAGGANGAAGVGGGTAADGKADDGGERVDGKTFMSAAAPGVTIMTDDQLEYETGADGKRHAFDSGGFGAVYRALYVNCELWMSWGGARWLMVGVMGCPSLVAGTTAHTWL